MLMTKYIDCVCGTAEHTIRFTLDEEEKEVCVEIHLSHVRSFFGRIKMAIKYIFGYECKYGHFECALLDESKVHELTNTLAGFIVKANMDSAGAKKIKKALKNIREKAYKARLDTTFEVGDKLPYEMTKAAKED